MDEHDPVDDAEFVFRRIHRSFYTAGVPTPVWPWAFRPNAKDSTGVSVFRESFGPAACILTQDPSKANDYYIARLSVRALRELGLSVDPDPVVGDPLGHAIIPELSWPAYQARKAAIKSILLELAKFASADIVHQAS